MRLLMYGDGERRLGVLTGERVLDVAELARAAGAAVPPTDLLGLIEAGEPELDRLRDLVAMARVEGRPLGEVRLLAPLDPPRGNVLALGRNYLAHAEEGARAMGTEVGPPAVFTKAQTTISGPYDDIRIWTNVSEKVDWEVELAVVIGRRARDVAPAEALEHVFGYMVLNDVTARDLQRDWGGQWFKGKSLDGYCPTGPWVVTRDEIPDPQALTLWLRVNGVTKQHASTRDMIYSVAEIVSRLSIGMTLLPGTVIATGTPEGVGFARTPPEYLRPGDVMESEVSSIGVLRNRIVAG
jgi:2-keto-4-pentenoate hydratase/2-oxohepta-3-ene-1,7-dioic acid hydratase in catechol pathway